MIDRNSRRCAYHGETRIYNLLTSCTGCRGETDCPAGCVRSVSILGLELIHIPLIDAERAKFIVEKVCLRYSTGANLG